MALYLDFGASFNSMQDWKGIRDYAGEVNGTKAYDMITDFCGHCTSSYLCLSQFFGNRALPPSLDKKPT